jgi:hypothetical protein
MKSLLLFAWAFALPVLAQRPQPLPNAPLAQLAPAYESFTYPATECGTQVFTDGTSVCIPAGALVDGRGQSIDGPITVRYRAVRSPFQMLTAGLNMHAQVNGRKVWLESSGMFELRATDHTGQPLQVKPGQRISVRFRTLNPLPDLRFWKYDERAAQWQELPNVLLLPDSEATGLPLAANNQLTEEMLYNGDYMSEEGSDYLDKTWFQFEEYRQRAFQKMGLEGFGWFNCDRIVNPDELPVPIVARVALPATEQIDTALASLYIVYEELNSLVTVPYTQLRTQFQLLPNKAYKLVLVYGMNKLATQEAQQLPPDEVRARRNQPVTFQFTPVTTAQPVEELCQKVGFY